MAFPVLPAEILRHPQPLRKRALEERDLQVVAGLVCEGLREGLYAEYVPGGTRAEVLRFLRHLAARCEIARRAEGGTVQRRAAALFVYTLEDAVVGFSVLAQTATQSARHGVELVMLGVVPVRRGLGYGASIVDSLLRTVSQLGFNLIVRCPSDSQLLFAMLVMRGFLVAGRYCRGRVLQFLPPALRKPAGWRAELLGASA
ncbi:MAG: hypothetical protein WDO13_18850 [Verrucomicrobiota bacterium]